MLNDLFLIACQVFQAKIRYNENEQNDMSEIKNVKSPNLEDHQLRPELARHMQTQQRWCERSK